MKKALAVILALTMVFSLAGQALAAAPAAEVPADSVVVETKTEGEVTRGGTLVMAKSLESQTGLDITTIDYLECHFLLLSLIYEPLLTIDDDGNIAPGLATEWAFSDDGMSLTLKLREDVSFSNGEKFNAEAAAKTINFYKSDDCTHALASNLESIKDAEVVDEYTIRINMNTMDSNLEYNLSSSIGMMVAPELIDKKDLSVPVGTGPFILEEYKESEYAYLTRNPNYYKLGVDGQPLPYLDAVKLIIMTDDTTQITNLKSGDVMGSEKLLSTTTVMTVESADNMYLLENGGSAQVCNLAMNITEGHVGDIKLRQAIEYAIDKEELVEIAYESYGEARDFWSPQGCWFYNDYNPYTYDLDKAKELLAESEAGEGTELELAIISREPDATIAQAIQYQLSKIGLKITINAMDAASWVAYVRENHDHDMTLANVTGAGFAPSTYWRYILLPIGDEAVMDDMRALLDQTVVTIDINERKALIDEYQTTLMDLAAFCPIGTPYSYAGFNSAVQGVRVNYWGWTELANAYIAQ